MTTLVSVAAVVVPLISVQTFWIARSLDTLGDTLGKRIDRIDTRLDGIETTLVRDHGERIARLEGRA